MGHGARNDFENIVRECVQGGEHSMWMEVTVEDEKPKKEGRKHSSKGDGRAGVGSERCPGTTEQMNPPVRAYYERHAGQPLEMRCEM